MLAGGGRWADVALAVGAGGAVQVAYLGQTTGPTSLRVASGHRRRAAPASRRCSPTGGKGTSSGTQVATAFSADGTATVAWGKPGNSYEEGGTLEVFTRAAGRRRFGARADARRERARDSRSPAAPVPRPRWPG